MSYLEIPWTDPSGYHHLPGHWVPETNLERWKTRGVDMPLRTAWTSLSGPSAEQVSHFDALDEEARLKYFALLGGDIGSAQRDGLFYFNALERLKNEPTDALADVIIEQMGIFGLTSVNFSPSAGGPPPHRSPRPFRAVIDWLLRHLGDVSKLLLNAVAFITTRLHELGLSAVALQVGWPVAVSLEFPPNLFRDPPRWRKASELVNKILQEMGDRVFAA